MDSKAICDKCIFLEIVHKHPKNNTIGKGEFTDQLGYICRVHKHNSFFETIDNHGCELFLPSTEFEFAIQIKNK